MPLLLPTVSGHRGGVGMTVTASHRLSGIHGISVVATAARQVGVSQGDSGSTLAYNTPSIIFSTNQLWAQPPAAEIDLNQQVV